MYESSVLTVVYKYVLPISLIGVTIVWITICFMNGESFVLSRWKEGTVLIGLSFIFAFDLIKLRKVSINDKHIELLKWNGNEIIEYTSVEWVSQAYFRPHKIFIKYKTKSNRSRLIFVLPEYDTGEYFSYNKDCAMTIYLRGMISIKNQKYTRVNEPSSWLYTVLLISFCAFLWFINYFVIRLFFT